MAKGISFNFGANRVKKSRSKKSKKGKSGKVRTGKKGKAWRQYVGSNAPIPD